MMINKKKLNKEQKEAVIHNEGPALVVAGAGTGKTAVITERIARLVSSKKALPEEILALTFTDKAAGEMEERVEDLLPLSYSYSNFWISTFHAFCDRILRNHALDIGLPVGFKVADETGLKMLFKRNLEDFNLKYYKPTGNPLKFIGAIISHFSRCKDEMIYPDDYLSFVKNSADKERIREIANIYQRYQGLLLKNELFDFGDLIGYCLKLFQKRPLILEKYRQHFKYILVDEFQDTNRAQYELLRMISQPKNNIMICLDDNQAIYRWRGASLGNIANFTKDNPRVKKIVLTKNYRSLQNILDLTHNFITTQTVEKHERLQANRKGKGKIEHLHFKTLEYELIGVAEKIFAILKKDPSANFNDIAILTRTNNDANLITRSCERYGIPCQFLSLKGLYQKDIILDLISYFKLLDNYHENSAVYRVLNIPFLLVSPQDIAKITQYGHRKSISIYSVLFRIAEVPEISLKTTEKVNKLIKMIEQHTLLAAQKNVSEVFISFLNDSGYLEYLTKKEDLSGIDYINQFFDRIKKFEDSNSSIRLRDFMQEFNLEIETGESGTLIPVTKDDNSVKIMTVHSAKGLEFKYIIISNLVERRFPSVEKSDLIEFPAGLLKENGSHLREERRLFYVAMTRAMDGLFFTSAENYGGFRKKKISQFLSELGFYVEKTTKTSLIPQKNNLAKRVFSPEPPKYLSFSQIKAYSCCPLQYKFVHILKIPLRERPSYVFGKVMHSVVFKITQSIIEGDISLSRALDIYNSFWIDDWYESRKQRDEYYRKGKKGIKILFKEFNKNPPKVAFIKGKPALEQGFIFNIRGYFFKGKIDRLDQEEIIDYKTGLFKPNLRSEDKDQLIIYQLAVKELFRLDIKKLTYYYLEEGKKVSFEVKEKERERVIKKTIEKAEAIRKRKFAPTPGWHCASCDFVNICKDAQKR